MRTCRRRAAGASDATPAARSGSSRSWRIDDSTRRFHRIASGEQRVGEHADEDIENDVEDIHLDAQSGQTFSRDLNPGESATVVYVFGSDSRVTPSTLSLTMLKTKRQVQVALR